MVIRTKHKDFSLLSWQPVLLLKKFTTFMRSNKIFGRINWSSVRTGSNLDGYFHLFVINLLSWKIINPFPTGSLNIVRTLKSCNIFWSKTKASINRQFCQQITCSKVCIQYTSKNPRIMLGLPRIPIGHDRTRKQWIRQTCSNEKAVTRPVEGETEIIANQR